MINSTITDQGFEEDNVSGSTIEMEDEIIEFTESFVMSYSSGGFLNDEEMIDGFISEANSQGYVVLNPTVVQQERSFMVAVRARASQVGIERALELRVFNTREGVDRVHLPSVRPVTVADYSRGSELSASAI